jgi:hypothetical protein
MLAEGVAITLGAQRQPRICLTPKERGEQVHLSLRYTNERSH